MSSRAAGSRQPRGSPGVRPRRTPDVAGASRRPQVGHADHHRIDPGAPPRSRPRAARPAGDSIMAITTVSASADGRWVSGSTDPKRPAGCRWRKPRCPTADSAPTRPVPGRRPQCRCVARSPRRPRRPARAAPARSRSIPTRTRVGTPCSCGKSDVPPHLDHVRRTVLAVEKEKVEAADRGHLDQLLRRHPQQHPQQLVPGADPGLEDSGSSARCPSTIRRPYRRTDRRPRRTTPAWPAWQPRQLRPPPR